LAVGIWPLAVGRSLPLLLAFGSWRSWLLALGFWLLALLAFGLSANSQQLPAANGATGQQPTAANCEFHSV